MTRLDEIERDLRYLGIGNTEIGRICVLDGVALVAVARAAAALNEAERAVACCLFGSGGDYYVANNMRTEAWRNLSAALAPLLAERGEPSAGGGR